MWRIKPSTQFHPCRSNYPVSQQCVNYSFWRNLIGWHTRLGQAALVSKQVLSEVRGKLNSALGIKTYTMHPKLWLINKQAGVGCDVEGRVTWHRSQLEKSSILYSLKWAIEYCDEQIYDAWSTMTEWVLRVLVWASLINQVHTYVYTTSYLKLWFTPCWRYLWCTGSHHVKKQMGPIGENDPRHWNLNIKGVLFQCVSTT